MAYQFTVESKSLTPRGMVPDRYLYNGFGCHGENISPHVEWSGAPSETKSFAVTLFDPDAPTPHGWWHWAVINIPNNVKSIDEGASNKGALPNNSQELLTDFKANSYGGPCPPEGDKPHRYILTVYALRNDKLDVDSETTAEMLKDRLQKTSLGTASFTVMYGR